MNSKSPESRINPDIQRVDVGRKVLHTISIYPLSATFQLSLAKDVSTLLVDLFSIKWEDLTGGQVNQKMADFFLKLISENMIQLLRNAIDPEELSSEGYKGVEDLMEDLATTQFTRICEIIYEKNYKELVGKGSGLLKTTEAEQIKDNLTKASATKESSPTSVDTIQDTSSETSEPHITEEA